MGFYPLGAGKVPANVESVSSKSVFKICVPDGSMTTFNSRVPGEYNQEIARIEALVKEDPSKEFLLPRILNCANANIMANLRAGYGGQ